MIDHLLSLYFGVCVVYVNPLLSPAGMRLQEKGGFCDPHKGTPPNCHVLYT